MRKTAAPPLVGLLAAGAFVLGWPKSPPRPARTDELPELGTVLRPLPDGSAKSVADAACLQCHSADMIRQQRLTRKQWEADVTKMIGWGAAVPEDRKDELVNYLFENFGPENDRFEPVVARSVRR